MNLEQLQNRNRELHILNTIAHQLNREVSLDKALSVTLKHSVELLGMQTGWIWLVHPGSNAVYLAASFNLPPIFRQHPERLSGWCYCIDKYLANNLESAANISEITCSRLKDLEEGTDGLRFHATIPLFSQTEKIGILNVVSAQSQQLSDAQLELLYTIGDLLCISIDRARRYELSHQAGVLEERQRLSQRLQDSLIQNIEKVEQHISELLAASGKNADLMPALQKIQKMVQQNLEATKASMQALAVHANTTQATQQPLTYPYTPLTEREMEVLNLLKAGKTNKAIAADLFLSERTIKFHVSAILSKLNASNRTDAVQIAVRGGLVSLV
ncbi:MAG: hypothetical protein DHS20C18_33350 [Saprospiraceae bacterium]|nr:MAG: hypothetical protein DHS20C18_33350 [Saprospiraceae bacterium]